MMTVFAVMRSSNEVWKDLRMMRSSALWKGFSERLSGVDWLNFAWHSVAFAWMRFFYLWPSGRKQHAANCRWLQCEGEQSRVSAPEALESWKTSFPSRTASFEGLCMTMIDYVKFQVCTTVYLLISWPWHHGHTKSWWFFSARCACAALAVAFWKALMAQRHGSWEFEGVSPQCQPHRPMRLLRDLLPVPTRPICRCNWMSAVRTTPIMCASQRFKLVGWGSRDPSPEVRIPFIYKGWIGDARNPNPPTQTTNQRLSWPFVDELMTSCGVWPMNSLLKVAAVDQARKLRQGFGSWVIKMSGIWFASFQFPCFSVFFLKLCFGSLFFSIHFVDTNDSSWGVALAEGFVQTLQAMLVQPMFPTLILGGHVLESERRYARSKGMEPPDATRMDWLDMQLISADIRLIIDST